MKKLLLIMMLLISTIAAANHRVALVIGNGCSPPVKKEWLKVENSINLNEGVFYEEIKIYR